MMETSFMDLFGKLNVRLEKEEIELLIMIAQKIWFRRNRWVFEGELVPPICLMKCAVEDLEEFQKSSEGELSNAVLGFSPPTVKWSHPMGNVIKVNWDSAVSRRKKMIGVGVVARDSIG
jgi:hypothetical protein